MDQRVKDALIGIVGKQNASDALMDLVSYSYDFSEFRSRPDMAVWPRITEQISEILKLARREKIPVVPRGNNSKMI